jgi:hypothetical protein
MKIELCLAVASLRSERSSESKFSVYQVIVVRNMTERSEQLVCI